MYSKNLVRLNATLKITMAAMVLTETPSETLGGACGRQQETKRSTVTATMVYTEPVRAIWVKGISSLGDRSWKINY